MKNKVVIVTGSSNGIGKEAARQFFKKGAKIVFVGLEKEKLKLLENEFGTKRAFYLKLDLSKEVDCKKLIDETKRKFGKIDVLVNNVGRGFRGEFVNTKMKTFKEIIDVNLMSAVYCSKYAISEIIASKGSIVFVSSVAAYRGLPRYGPYSVSKAGINSFCEILDSELSRKGVHVGRISFGPVENEKGKVIIRAKGAKDYSNASILISLDKAGRKIVECVEKRRFVMNVGLINNFIFIANKFFSAILRFYLKKFSRLE